MIRNQSLVWLAVFLAVHPEDPFDERIVIFKFPRGVQVLYGEGDPEVGLIQVRILAFLNIDIVVIDVWVVLLEIFNLGDIHFVMRRLHKINSISEIL